MAAKFRAAAAKLESPEATGSWQVPSFESFVKILDDVCAAKADVARLAQRREDLGL